MKTLTDVMNRLPEERRARVQAMGGSLDLIARFPDRPDVTLSGLFGFDRLDEVTAQKNKDTATEQHSH